MDRFFYKALEKRIHFLKYPFTKVIHELETRACNYVYLELSKIESGIYSNYKQNYSIEK